MEALRGVSRGKYAVIGGDMNFVANAATDSTSGTKYYGADQVPVR